MESNTCTFEGCDRPIVNKTLKLCQTHYMAHRRALKKEAKTKQISPLQFVISAEIIEGMSKARTTEDWQTLGEAIAPIMSGIMAGNVIASAAQVSLIKDIMNRAYGKPVATQAEKKVSTGILILPALDTGQRMTICPRCQYDIDKTVSTKSDDQS